MKESKNNKLNLRGKLFNSIISTALIIAIAVVGIPFTASAQVQVNLLPAKKCFAEFCLVKTLWLNFFLTFGRATKLPNS
jgi:hypothetical protein